MRDCQGWVFGQKLKYREWGFPIVSPIVSPVVSPIVFNGSPNVTTTVPSRTDTVRTIIGFQGLGSPPRQKPASFNLDRVLEKLNEDGAASA